MCYTTISPCRVYSIEYAHGFVVLSCVVVCSKTWIVGLLVCSILHEENCVGSKFTDQEDMVCFNHTSAISIWATASWKMFMNNKIKAQTFDRKFWYLSRQVLVSHASNMSCSFGQSVCSIESRCMVIFSVLGVFLWLINNDVDHYTWKEGLYIKMWPKCLGQRANYRKSWLQNIQII